MAENLSIVIPVYNERDNILPLYQKITDVLKGWTGIGSYEILFVDDGSTDGSYDVSRSIRDEHVVPLRLAAHVGQTAAINAGIQASRYSLLSTMDADLQNDPTDLPALWAKMGEGFDFVQGRREKREDPWIRKASSRIANSVRRLILGDPFHDIGCSLRMFKKKSIEGISLFDGAHRFLPFLVQRNGFRVTECYVRHHPRVAGVSKYNVRNRLFKSLKDLARVRFGR